MKKISISWIAILLIATMFKMQIPAKSGNNVKLTYKPEKSLQRNDFSGFLFCRRFDQLLTNHLVIAVDYFSV